MSSSSCEPPAPISVVCSQAPTTQEQGKSHAQCLFACGESRHRASPRIDDRKSSKEGQDTLILGRILPAPGDLDRLILGRLRPAQNQGIHITRSQQEPAQNQGLQPFLGRCLYHSGLSFEPLPMRPQPSLVEPAVDHGTQGYSAHSQARGT